MQHSSSFPSGSETQSDARIRRNLAIARRRRPQRFMICDASLNILFSNTDVAQALEAEVVKEQLKVSCREALLGGTEVVYALDDENIFRIVPLGAAFFGGVAIFVDNFSHRGSLFENAKAFRLTKRESEVLQLLMAGKSNAQIAVSLFVAECTVSDHVKSVMRKMGVNKRVEIFSRLLTSEHDLAEQHS
jgi:DNA-binding CsgD family transcriptional regulator